MKELTHNAKIAVLKILNDIVNADNIVKDVEVDYMNEIARSFELADNYGRGKQSCYVTSFGNSKNTIN